MAGKIMYIEREVYKSLVNWKNSGEEPLLVEGARQVGKTYLVKKFAEENFSTYLYIDMASNSGDRLLSLLNKHKNANSNKEMLIKALTEFSPHFKDNSNTLVIIDEIQESYEVYNLIRSFNRECKWRFILISSYLGRVSLDKKMWVSAGDLTKLEIKPLTFREFLKAVNSEVVSLFDTIDLYNKQIN
ncbi:MAG: AAA family ATPase [Clostridium sp.]